MDSFSLRIQEWQPFYATVGTACATLTGLLFVSLSLNVDTLTRPENAELMRLARRSFGDFLYVLMIAFVFLVPRQAPIGFAVAMLALSGSRLFGLFRLYSGLRSEQGMSSSARRGLLAEFTLPLAAAVGLAAAAFAILFGYLNALYWLVGVIALLLANASSNAWRLLVHARPVQKT
jgi:hypothetical protein